ncbi:hypothetical protein AMATHDRAFT_149164 [Amanita thiersii Skay4041]|uniref:V-type proton ATPase subunit n=1 Tax=Amanita thiersii Skay4041 TaxID=703135 RepID=A0A2A9NM37_9AGAR|nr:hypothetical protein AMATHDRAFT_149164 [Amanita thiersii Skay4041]
MASLFPVAFIFVIVAALMVCVALFTPKGPNQVVLRTSLLLALVACYLLWMVTYLAQLHPLVGKALITVYMRP